MLRKRRKRKGKERTLEGTFLSRHSLFRG